MRVLLARRTRHTTPILLVLLCLVVAFTYRPYATFFSQDDFWFLDRVRRANSLSSFLSLVGAEDHFYRPVPRVLLLKFEYLFFDLQPFAYHAFSWLLHVANCGMLFGLWRILWKNNRLGFLAALYYGLHYVHFVPVSWVSGLQELSVLFWSLLAVLTYVHSRKYDKRWSLVLSLLAFGLAVFSKENGLSVFVLILLVDVVLRPRTWSAFLLGKVGYIGVALIFLWIRTLKAGELLSSGPYAWHFDLGLAWRNILWYVSEGMYLRTWVVNRPGAGSLIVLVLAALLFWVYCVSKRHRKPLLVAGLGFVAALAPVLFLERTYSYYFCLPLLGFGLLMAVMVDFLWAVVERRTETAAFTRGVSVTTVGGLVLVGWIALNQVGLQYVRDKDPLGLQDKARIGLRAVEQVLSLYPHLPDQSTLYVRGASERDYWALGKGSLFSLYYYPQTVEVLFDLNTPLTTDLTARSNFYVYDFK